MATEQVKRYEDRLVRGELVSSRIAGTDKPVPIFLTFPTGWRYHPQYWLLRKASLDAIRTAISGGLGAQPSKAD